MAFWKESMINRLSNLINRNRSAAKISQVLCSSWSSLDGAIYRALCILSGRSFGKTFDNTQWRKVKQTQPI